MGSEGEAGCVIARWYCLQKRAEVQSRRTLRDRVPLLMDVKLLQHLSAEIKIWTMRETGLKRHKKKVLSVNPSTYKVQWGITFLSSLTLHLVGIINHTKRGGRETERRQSKWRSYAACRVERAAGEPQNMPVCSTPQRCSCVFEQINDRPDEERDRKCCFHFGTHKSIWLHAGL